MANNWIKIDEQSPQIKAEPWSLYWREMKSESPEFRDFLLNPLPFLKAEVPEIDESYQISTNILNHEKGLVISAVCTMVTIIPDKKQVILTFYKH